MVKNFIIHHTHSLSCKPDSKLKLGVSVISAWRNIQK